MQTSKLLRQWRQAAPTAISLLIRWPAVPRLLLRGAALMFVFIYVADLIQLPYLSHWIVGVACLIFGAALRDVAYARRIALTWPVQKEFIDWQKVDDTLA
jgi:hypothetical protein